MDRLSANRSDMPNIVIAAPKGEYALAEFEQAVRGLSAVPKEQRAFAFQALENQLPAMSFDARIEAAGRLISATTVLSSDEQMAVIAAIIDTVEQSIEGKDRRLMLGIALSLESEISTAMQIAGAPYVNICAVYSPLIRLSDRYMLPDFAAQIAYRMASRASVTSHHQRVEAFRNVIQMTEEFRPEHRAQLFAALLKRLPADAEQRHAILDLLTTQTQLLPPGDPDTIAIEARLAQLLHQARLQRAANEHVAKRHAS